MGVPREYTCVMCRETFSGEWSDEEALAEALEVFGEAARNPDDCDVVCDDCWQIVKPKGEHKT